MRSMRDKLRREHKKEAAAFILEKGSEYHEAFEAPVIYNEESEKFELPPAASDLEEALLAYNESVDPRYRFNIQTCTFEDAVLELDQARGVYEKKAQGLGILRKGIRKAGEYADDITPWIGLIPSDYGLSFLTAGLTIIFRIAKQNSNNSGRILGAFQDIPELMLTTKKRQTQWASSGELRASAIELYTVLAWALARLIVILNGSMSHHPRLSERAGKFVKRLLASGYTSKSIDGILSGVQKQAKEFDQCLEYVRDDLAIQTGAHVVSTEAKVDKIGDAVRESNSSIAELLKKVQNNQNGVQIFNDMHQHLVVYIQPNFPVERNSSPSPSKHLEPFLNDTELLNSLGISARAPSNDLNTVIKDLDSFDFAAQEQAQQLFASRRFAEWMASHDPATLLVHGNFDTPGLGRVTALSVLCALFALQLHSNNNNYIVLHFFCGLHGAPNDSDPLTGPNGLIRSLLAQMLHTGRSFNLQFINTRLFADDIQAHSLKMLSHTFSQLVEQLPRKTTVVCIIDGVTEFESQQWRDELSDVLLILNRLVTNPALRPTFKLLATTPFATGFIDRNIKAQFSLQLQPMGSADGYSFSERTMPNDISQGSRVDHYRMRMQMNRAQEDDYDDSDDDESDLSE